MRPGRCSHARRRNLWRRSTTVGTASSRTSHAPPTLWVGADGHLDATGIQLSDGLVNTLRKVPELHLSPRVPVPAGPCSIELEAGDGSLVTWRHDDPTRWEPFDDVPPGRARARLARWSEEEESEEPVAVGPWVDFVVPESGEGSLVLDLRW